MTKRRKGEHYVKERDRKKKNRKGSSTPGIMKVSSCQKADWKNLYTSSRGYKHSQYGDWCEKIDKLQ